MKPSRATHELVGDMRVLARALGKVRRPESRVMLHAAVGALCRSVLDTSDASGGMRDAALEMLEEARYVTALDGQAVAS